MEEKKKKVLRKKPEDKKKSGAPIKWTDTKLKNLADKMLKYFKADESKRRLQQFCIDNDLLAQNMSEFAQISPYFSESLKKVKQICEQRTIDFAEETNTTFGIFNLKCNYGWVDKQVIEQNTTLSVEGSFASAIKEIGDAAK